MFSKTLLVVALLAPSALAAPFTLVNSKRTDLAARTLSPHDIISNSALMARHPEHVRGRIRRAHETTDNVTDATAVANSTAASNTTSNAVASTTATVDKRNFLPIPGLFRREPALNPRNKQQPENQENDAAQAETAAATAAAANITEVANANATATAANTTAVVMDVTANTTSSDDPAPILLELGLEKRNLLSGRRHRRGMDQADDATAVSNSTVAAANTTAIAMTTAT